MQLRKRVLIGSMLFALLAGACGETAPDAAGDPADDDEQTAPDDPGDDDATEQPDATEPDATAPDAGEGDEDKHITLGATGTLSFSRIPAAVTRDRLNEEGWDIEWVEFSSEDLKVEAVAAGTVDIAQMQALDAVRVIQLGGDIVNLASDRPDEFVAIAPADVGDCSELEGTRLAIHSEGSTYTHIYDYWLTTVCGVTDYERLVISGGDNRVIAMMQGQVDGTNVQMADFIALDEQAPGQYQILANFGREIDGLVGGMVVANKTWVEENRSLAVEYLAETLKDYRAANEDGAAMRETAETYQSAEDVASFDRVREVYLDDLGGFPDCGLLDQDVVTDLIGLFEELGMIEPGLEPDEVVDFSVLEDARAMVDHC